MANAHWEELVAHAREEAPNECCGYLRANEGAVEEVVRAKNVYESPPYGYRLDSDSMLQAWKAGEAGQQVGTYHSHPRSPARPSEADINLAEYPDWLYLIVSLEGEPEVRAWWIKDGRVEEEDVVVE